MSFSFTWLCPCLEKFNYGDAEITSWSAVTCTKCEAEVEIETSIEVDDIKVITPGKEGHYVDPAQLLLFKVGT